MSCGNEDGKFEGISLVESLWSEVVTEVGPFDVILLGIVVDTLEVSPL